MDFLKEYGKIKRYLSKEDIGLIEPLVVRFSQVDIKILPSCFVHGDIIDTNVIRSSEGKLYVLDFSVANIYPRIQELAVMLCDILFVPDKKKFQKVYDRTLAVYQKRVYLKNTHPARRNRSIKRS